MGFTPLFWFADCCEASDGAIIGLEIARIGVGANGGGGGVG